MTFASIEVTYDDHGLEGKIRRYLSAVTGTEGEKRAKKVQKAARLDCGFNTGALAASIKVWRVSVNIRRDERVEVWTVGSELHYAAIVHNGVNHPYLIPKLPKMGTLRFVGSKGDVVFRKQVIHPGITGKFYLTKNLWRALT